MNFFSQLNSCLRSSIFNTELGSAIIGALITATAVAATILWEAYKAKKTSDDEVRAICGAIKTELQGILIQYNEVKERIDGLEENEPYPQNYRIDEDYFVVYHANTSFLGKLPDPVKTDIVLAYIKMKSLVDTFRENNHILETYESFILANSESTTHFVSVIHSYKARLVSMGASLKVVSSDAITSANTAILSLEKFLSKKKA